MRDSAREGSADAIGIGATLMLAGLVVIATKTVIVLVPEIRRMGPVTTADVEPAVASPTPV